MNTDNANRTYQDTVFRRLFSTKEKLIELYNAMEQRQPQTFRQFFRPTSGKLYGIGGKSHRFVV